MRRREEKKELKAHQPDTLEKQIDQFLEGGSGTQDEAIPQRAQEKPTQDMSMNPKKRKRKEEGATDQEIPRRPRPKRNKGSWEESKKSRGNKKGDTQHGETSDSRSITQARHGGNADLDTAQKLRIRRDLSTCAEKEGAQKTPHKSMGEIPPPPILQQAI